MNKDDLLAVLKPYCHSAVMAGQGLDALLDAMADALARGEQVRLRGVGKLVPVQRAGRSGRGLNGETYTVGPSRTVKLIVSAPLKDALNPV